MKLYMDFEKKLGEFQLKVSYAGERGILGILGASGCGKSMTLKSIAGIETPDSGTIRIGDQVLFDASSRINLRPQQRKVGYLFQSYALFPTMTVEQNIMAGLTGRKQEKLARVREMVERFQISGLEKRLPGQLSGGQQQRVALARIMAYEPEALLLDEPFSAMDVYLKERLRLEMAEVLREYQGVSVLVTHDRDEAYQLCDQLMLMDNGRVIKAGPTKQLFEQPGSVQAARLTGCKNLSRIEKLGPHKVRALDWDGLELLTRDEVSDPVTHVGIRAHDFTPLNETEYRELQASGELSVIPVRDAKITELPFEWYIMLSQGLWWKVPKAMHTHDRESLIPYGLAVDPSAVMLLEE